MYIIHPFALYLVLRVKVGINIIGKYRICPDAHEHIGEVHTSVTLAWKLTAEPKKYHFCPDDRLLAAIQLTIDSASCSRD